MPDVPYSDDNLPPEVADSLPEAPLLTAEEAETALSEEEEWEDDPDC